MGNYKSKNKEYPNSEVICDFYYKYINNPTSIHHHSILDFFQAHYLKMIEFCNMNNISDDDLWILVRNKGNSNNCLCSECHPDLYE
uniref:Uncharacterized protein n=1 Tax=viral metagenome TaxID=1070528 RepID=A0A6C0E7D7_9ZZZZ